MAKIPVPIILKEGKEGQLSSPFCSARLLLKTHRLAMSMMAERVPIRRFASGTASKDSPSPLSEAAKEENERKRGKWVCQLPFVRIELNQTSSSSFPQSSTSSPYLEIAELTSNDMPSIQRILVVPLVVVVGRMRLQRSIRRRLVQFFVAVADFSFSLREGRSGIGRHREGDRGLKSNEGRR